jgi:hypothetical protein
MQYKPISFPSLHVETLKLSLNEELLEKQPTMDLENFGKYHRVIM